MGKGSLSALFVDAAKTKMDMLKRLIHKKRKNPETCEVQILYSCNNCLGIIEVGSLFLASDKIAIYRICL